MTSMQSMPMSISYVNGSSSGGSGTNKRARLATVITEELPPSTHIVNTGFNGYLSASAGTINQCNHCNKILPTDVLLRQHMSMFHSEKAFVCEICGKAFRFRSNLAEHRSVHTALKPYVCKFCGKSSRLKGNLTKHILKHHRKEQTDYIGKDDIIIKKGKKSMKDPAAVDFLEKSMIVLTSATSSQNNNDSIMSSNFPNIERGNDLIEDSSPTSTSISVQNSAAMQLYSIAQLAGDVLCASNNNFNGVMRMDSNNNNSTADLSNSPEDSSIGSFQNYEEEEEDEDEEEERDEKSSLAFAGGPSAVAPFVPNNHSMHSRFMTATAQNNNNNNNNNNINQNINSHAERPSSASSPSPMYGASNRNQCSECGKHFRKGGNSLQLHMTLSHGFAPPVTTTTTTITTTNTTVSKESNRTTMDNSRNGSSCHHREVMSPSDSSISRSQSREQKQQQMNFIFGQNSSNNNNQNQNQNNGKNHEQTENENRTTKTMTASINEDLRELKHLIEQFRMEALNENRVGSRKQIPAASSGRVEQLLTGLDARVARLEKQLEMALNSIYTLVQLQTGINSAVTRFRDETLDHLKALRSLLNNSQ